MEAPQQWGVLCYNTCMEKAFKLEELEKTIEAFLEYIEANKKRILGFSGNLGAGKTTFTKKILEKLGHTGGVPSPTFVLRRDYEIGPSPLLTSPSRGGDVPLTYLANKQNYDSLKSHAVQMRKNPTKAEDILWDHLRKDKLGVRFRRQHLIDNFIVDFINLPNKLIIEVDGAIHDEQMEKDDERTKVLQSLGFKVIRFSNKEILENIDGVLKEIDRNLQVLPGGEDLGGANVRRTKLIHIDAYRLEKPEHLFQVISQEELNDQKNFVIIEWPEKVDGKIFDEIFIFEHVDESTRKISTK